MTRDLTRIFTVMMNVDRIDEANKLLVSMSENLKLLDEYESKVKKVLELSELLEDKTIHKICEELIKRSNKE